MSGCGGNDSSGDGAKTTADAGAERKAVLATTSSWIDDDDCAAMSDSFAAEGYGSASEGRRACEADDTPGLERGDYSVGRVTVSGRRASVRLRLAPDRAYVLGLVHTPAGWRVDSSREELTAQVGRSLPLREDYLKNGTPVTIAARIAVVAIEDAEPPAGALEAGTGKHWVRVAMRADSTGGEPLEPKAFDLSALSSGGIRLDPVQKAPFTPRFGFEDTRFPRGTTATGFVTFAVEDGQSVREVDLTSTGPDRWRWLAPSPRK